MWNLLKVFHWIFSNQGLLENITLFILCMHLKQWFSTCLSLWAAYVAQNVLSGPQVENHSTPHRPTATCSETPPQSRVRSGVLGRGPGGRDPRPCCADLGSAWPGGWADRQQPRPQTHGVAPGSRNPWGQPVALEFVGLGSSSGSRTVQGQPAALVSRLYGAGQQPRTPATQNWPVMSTPPRPSSPDSATLGGQAAGNPGPLAFSTQLGRSCVLIGPPAGWEPLI